MKHFPFARFLVRFQIFLLAFQKQARFLASARLNDNVFDPSAETIEAAEASITTSCEICGTGGTLTRPNGVISTAELFATCQVVQDNPALIPVGFCETLQKSSLIAAECGCTNPAQSCPVCGFAGGEITNPTGIITSAEIFGTCEVINNNQRVIPNSFCQTVQSSTLIAAECGCVDNTQFCPLCGDSTFVISNPNARISLAGVSSTCQLLNDNQRTIPAGTCVTFQAAAQNNDLCGCRDPQNSPQPSLSPTRTPAPTPFPPATPFELFFPTLFAIFERLFGIQI